MGDIDKTRSNGIVTLGALLALGLIIGGWVTGAQTKATRLSDRYVSVKGLVERNVKSDLVIWNLSYKEAGDDLAAVSAKTDGHTKIVQQFLAAQGIQSPEIELGVIRVVDTQANEYGGNRAPRRYIAERQITVRTSRVEQVAIAAQKTMQLLQKGVVLTSEPGQQALVYKFNGLNSIKPDMISEATRNARAAADRFALDSNSRVGAIRQANQGVFSILPADRGSADASAEGTAGDPGADSSLMKTVRIVTSVQYYLDK